jgi:hypothetical protein
VEIIPGQVEHHSGACRKVFGFRPESCSPGIRVILELPVVGRRAAIIVRKSSPRKATPFLQSQYFTSHWGGVEEPEIGQPELGEHLGKNPKNCPREVPPKYPQRKSNYLSRILTQPFVSKEDIETK